MPAPLPHRDIAGILKRHSYSEIKKIGEGSFGKAILVQNDEGAKIVCKMVDVSQASARETQDAIKESRLLASFKHPYIVRYRESFTDSGWLCILMDYCEGGDLTKQIETARKARKSIPEETVLRWMTQALLALKYIHEKHVLHRDLKAANLFLSKSGNLKLGDFGIATVLSCTAACAKTQIGTPYYLSPEVCQEKPYTWPSDIWAMGCILYELCALRVPFDAANISGLVHKICRGPTPQIPASYSEFLQRLCNDMLNRNPTSRPSAESVIQQPQINAIVKQLLEEAQALQQEAKTSSHGSALDEPRSEQTSERAQLPSVSRRNPSVVVPQISGPYADSAGSYRKGDLIEYHSSTHKEWLPASVTAVDMDGRIVIDLKPSTWLPREVQAQLVRPRRLSTKEQSPPAPVASATPLRMRTPSQIGGVAPAPGRVRDDVVWQSAGRPSANMNTPAKAELMPMRFGQGSRVGTPNRVASPGGRAMGPPGMPRVPNLPIRDIGGVGRPCRAANAAGMAIAGPS